MITNAEYRGDGSIIAVINAQEIIVPDDMGNRHRQMLADWATAGNTIAAYAPPPSPIPDCVSRRKFMLQLEAEQLLDKAEAWISSQDRAMQISFAESSSFYRHEPKLQEAFASIGYSTDKIDAFFVRANQQ